RTRFPSVATMSPTYPPVALPIRRPPPPSPPFPYTTLFRSLSMDDLDLLGEHLHTNARLGERESVCLVLARHPAAADPELDARHTDRKSTRLNSSHQIISYAVFCLKKKTKHLKTKTIA